MMMRNMIRRSQSQLRRYGSTLVVAEHDGSQVTAGTLSAINAAKKLGQEISVLVMGKGIGGVADDTAKLAGITKVLTVDSDSVANTIAEDISETLLPIAKNYSHIVAASSTVGKNAIPRVAALLDCAPLTDVLEIIDTETFKRPMYAGNAIATVKMTGSIKFLLVRPTAFDKVVEKSDSAGATIEALTGTSAKSPLSTFVSKNVTKSERPDLATARVVVSGGRGLKNGENFAMLEKLADKMGGAVGASRAAVDAGFVPNDYQVGQTGKVVAPDLYMAVGISGAIQHLSGMKDSKTIVAINKDKEAPIFQVADYGIVDDLFKVVPEIESKL